MRETLAVAGGLTSRVRAVTRGVGGTNPEVMVATGVVYL
jgi:hypothetical protein